MPKLAGHRTSVVLGIQTENLISGSVRAKGPPQDFFTILLGFGRARGFVHTTSVSVFSQLPFQALHLICSGTVSMHSLCAQSRLRVQALLKVGSKSAISAIQLD